MRKNLRSFWLSSAILAALLIPLLAPGLEVMAYQQDKPKSEPTKTDKHKKVVPTPTPTPQKEKSKVQTEEKISGDGAWVVRPGGCPKLKPRVVVICKTETMTKVKPDSKKNKAVSKRFKKKVYYKKRKLTVEQKFAQENRRELKKLKLKSSDILLPVASEAQLTYQSTDGKQVINLTPTSTRGMALPLKVRARITTSKPVRAKWESRSDHKLALEPKATGTSQLIVWIPGTKHREVRTITISDTTASTSGNLTTPQTPVPPPTVEPTPTPTPVTPPVVVTVPVDDVTPTVTPTVSPSPSPSPGAGQTTATNYGWVWWLAVVITALAFLAGLGIIFLTELRVLGIALIIVSVIGVVVLYLGLV